MTDCGKEWNDKALKAWDQWKNICSICGCPDEQKKILMVEVTRAFQKKLYAAVGNQLDSLFVPDYHTDSMDKDCEVQEELPSRSGRLPASNIFYKSDDSDEESDPEEPLESASDDEISENAESDFCDLDNEKTDDSLQDQNVVPDTPVIQHDIRIDWAHEFDCGIIEKTNSKKSPKNYKDHTWQCIVRSNDPPLKVIRGQLLGRVGIINEIAERFLRNNFHQIWEKQVSLQSAAAPDDEESDTLEDTIEDKKTSHWGTALDQSDKICLHHNFKNLFSNENAAIFLIYLTGFSSLFTKKISIAIPELQKYVGLSSTSPIYDRLNNVILPQIKALPSECLQSMAVPGACDFLIFLLISQIEPEKRASSLLYTVMDGMTNSKEEAMDNE